MLIWLFIKYYYQTCLDITHVPRLAVYVVEMAVLSDVSLEAVVTNQAQAVLEGLQDE